MTDTISQFDWRLAELLRYWRSKRPERLLPARADIDPCEIPRLLPDLVLTDVLADGSLRFRLVGTAMALFAGRDVTGRRFDEIVVEAGYRAYIEGLYRQVAETRTPLYTEGRYHHRRKNFMLTTKRMMLPLASDGDRVDMVMSGHIFELPASEDLVECLGGVNDFPYTETVRLPIGG
jgi:hypothetical protein